MSRKPILILVLALFAGLLLGSTSPAHAEELAIDGTKYWTMDEVVEESERYQQHNTICNGNRECEEYLEVAYNLAGGIHSAGAIFYKYYFMITAINPATSTIKVLFQNLSVKKWREAEEVDVFKNLYLFWWEKGEPRFNVTDFTGESPNRHEIFTRLAKENETWLEPNREIEIKVPEFDFDILKTTPIYFAVQSKYSDALSVRHFEDCLTKIEGRSDYECRAVFDEQGNILYYPTEIKKNKSIETTQNTKTTEFKKSAPELKKSIPELQTSTPTEEISTSTTGVPENLTESIEVPLAAKAEEKHEFPYWIIIFGFSGIFIVLWWLIPAKKLQKKS